jgi:SprB repeat
LLAGVYKVKIALANQPNCFVEKDITVNNTNAPTVNAPTLKPALCGQSNGSAKFSNELLTYKWSDGGNGATRSNLAVGTYTVSVTTPSVPTCPTILTVEILERNDFNVTATVTKKATCGQTNGAATINVTGGSGNYSYSWGDAATRTDLRAGVYNVFVTDETNGCKQSVTVTITEETATASSILFTTNNGNATIAPPVYVSCVGQTNGRIAFAVNPASLVTTIKRITNSQTVTNGQLSVGQYLMKRGM